MCKISRGLQNEGRCASGFVQVSLVANKIDITRNDLDSDIKWDDDL